MKTSPTCSVPFCTSIVATGPRPLSTRDSSTVPLAGASGSALSSRKSPTRRIISSRRGRFCLVLAETSTITVSPPHSSGIRSAIGELALHALGLSVGLVDLVDRHDDRHMGRLRVGDGFFGLRHHAVIGGHDEHDDVGDLRAARAHARERFVARRVDEDDAPLAHMRFICANVLRDSAGFARGDFGFANGVEQAGLAVVDVAHHGDHRRARLQIARALFLDFFFLNDLLFERDHLHDSVEGFGKVRGRGHIERLVDAGENAAVEQDLQQFLGANIELFGQLAHGDAFGDRDLARLALQPERPVRHAPLARRDPYLPARARDEACARLPQIAFRSAAGRARQAACAHRAACRAPLWERLRRQWRPGLWLPMGAWSGARRRPGRCGNRDGGPPGRGGPPDALVHPDELVPAQRRAHALRRAGTTLANGLARPRTRISLAAADRRRISCAALARGAVRRRDQWCSAPLDVVQAPQRQDAVLRETAGWHRARCSSRALPGATGTAGLAAAGATARSCACWCGWCRRSCETARLADVRAAGAAGAAWGGRRHNGGPWRSAGRRCAVAAAGSRQPSAHQAPGEPAEAGAPRQVVAGPAGLASGCRRRRVAQRAAAQVFALGASFAASAAASSSASSAESACARVPRARHRSSSSASSFP